MKKSKGNKERLKKKELKVWYNEVLANRKKTLYQLTHYVWMKLISEELEFLIENKDLSDTDLEKTVIDNVYTELNTDLDIVDRVTKDERKHFLERGFIDFMPKKKQNYS